MIPIMGALRQLAEATGAAIVLIHHQRKTGQISARAGESLRGHSSIEAALDLAILIEREEGSGVISLKSTKTRGVDVYPFSAEFTYTHKPGTTELETAKFWGLAVEDTTSDKAIEKAILDVLSLETLNQSSLVKAVKERGITGTNRILGVIKRLENSKKIKAETGAKGAQFYEIVS
jgi:RecA-family ATPase